MQIVYSAVNQILALKSTQEAPNLSLIKVPTKDKKWIKTNNIKIYVSLRLCILILSLINMAEYILRCSTIKWLTGV